MWMPANSLLPDGKAWSDTGSSPSPSLSPSSFTLAAIAATADEACRCSGKTTLDGCSVGVGWVVVEKGRLRP
jgi:hypothetical protein